MHVYSVVYYGIIIMAVLHRNEVLVKCSTGNTYRDDLQVGNECRMRDTLPFPL